MFHPWSIWDISIQFYFVEIWAIFVQMLAPTVATSSVCCFSWSPMNKTFLLALRLVSWSSCWSLHHQWLTRAISFVDLCEFVEKSLPNLGLNMYVEMRRHISLQEPSFVSWRHSENTKATYELLSRWWFTDFLGNFRTPMGPHDKSMGRLLIIMYLHIFSYMSGLI